ncbi:DUF2141 domain-containing protein [Microbulbifer hydrolyticus]|uniref:DUF2141 domain-containing protein n=1 Tax=Microbulbifer hydrolyticus TaxID=48074 RepID=A0A6P1T940_9GAMM|nr:DUF2141 domain-containing protein [Microbulbifer hydrolyticus]MBB5210161.1 uncharacterized protein (DUF2141 family) [Microbulbifer hydrolyticus]QHQ39324.1 DUF2141 domain-containing protein [Microbulbifer hydrolyticus]
MNNPLLRFCLGVFVIFTCGRAIADTETANVKLTVSNIHSQVGKLYIAVYDSKDTFLGETKFFAEEVALENLKDGKLEVDLNLPYGQYAISVHHDNNANGKMDRNFVGIPKEPVGLSNGHVPRFGPPKFSKAVIDIAQPEQLENIALVD